MTEPVGATKPPQPQPPQPDLGILIALAYQGFVRDLHAFLRDEGFGDGGRSDGYVFRAVAEQPMTVSALAKRLDITKQGAGQIVEDMERRGFLHRVPDPSDRRARLVELSARGRAALAAARRFHAETERRLVAVHGQPSLTVLRTVLADLAGCDHHVGDPQLRAMRL